MLNLGKMKEATLLKLQILLHEDLHTSTQENASGAWENYMAVIQEMDRRSMRIVQIGRPSNSTYDIWASER